MKYIDLNGYHCELSFHPKNYRAASKHVLVIAKYKKQWLLTEHKKRGLEFPGGKVEPGESLLQAAFREVYEETGAVVENLEWFAEYVVHSSPSFSKTVFTAGVLSIDQIELMETNGAVLVDRVEPKGDYSFLMKDEGMKELIKRVNSSGKWKN